MAADSLRRLTPQDTIPSGDRATQSDDRARVRADSLVARTVDDGERLQELFGNVFVRQDSTRLRSREAVRYLSSDEFLFRGDVVIYERGDTLRSTTVRYDRRAKIGRAFGEVHLTDGDVDLYSSRAIYYSEEKRSVFPDSVLLVDASRTLQAASGVYYSDEQRADFFGNVQVRDPDTYMEADTVIYYREEERTDARGDVFIDRNPGRRSSDDRMAGYDALHAQATESGTGLDVAEDQENAASADAEESDTDDQTLLWGDRAENDEASKSSQVTGRALLLQVRTDADGVPTDTLLVRSHRLNATRSDTLDRMVAIDSVRIWQPDLAAIADSVVYDRFKLSDSTQGGEAPRETSLADTADTRTPTSEATRQDSAGSRSEPPDEESTRGDGPPSLEETRLFRSPMAWFDGSQVSGDTLRVVVRNRSVDTVFVRSNAFAAQEDTTSGRIQQLSGRRITAHFQRDSLRRIVAEPNARAIRFMTGRDGKANGAARTSADRIVLRFRDDEVHRVSVLGGTETTYYKEQIIPSSFQLEGFVWTPEHEPTKVEFMNDGRVRRRLPVEQQEATRPDTTAPDTSQIAAKPEPSDPEPSEAEPSEARPSRSAPRTTASPPASSTVTLENRTADRQEAENQGADRGEVGRRRSADGSQAPRSDSTATTDD